MSIQLIEKSNKKLGKFFCADIDECKEKPDICPRGRPVCVNVQGSYNCQARDESALLSPTVTCPAGYKFNNALQTCEGKS